MTRRLSLTLIPCVAVYILVAVTTSAVPRRATAKALTGPTSDLPLSADRSGYIVASS